MPAYRWVSQHSGASVPDSAIEGGRDIDGTTIYVGRAFHEGDMIPAKVIPEKNIAYISWGGQEHAKTSYEVLCRGEYCWEFCSGGQIPHNAVVGGQTSDGEPLYIGRVIHRGSQTIGKVHGSHGVLYIPFDGEELSFHDYEILIMN